MKIASKYLIIFIAVIGFASVLPKLYSTTFSQPSNTMLARYSAVIHDFVYMSVDNKGDRIYKDFVGNDYKQADFMKLLPFMYYSNLERWGEVPETVNGEYIDRVLIMAASDYIRVKPEDIDYLTKSRIKLYPLFESAGDISELSLPNEFFRMSDKMEFITTITNKVDEEKTTLFTNALKDNGFVFPAKLVAGNETTMKPYDFGYFIVDANGGLYHVFQAGGLPKVTVIDISNVDSEIIYAIVKEQRKPYYGLFVTNDGSVFRMSTDNYKLEKLYVENFNPYKNDLLYYSDMQNISMFVIDGNKEMLYVSDLEFNPVDTQYYEKLLMITGNNKIIFDTIFPFTISSNEYTTNMLPIINISENYVYSFVFAILLAIFYGVYRRRKASIGELIFIVIGGVYSLIVILLLNLSKTKR